MSRLRIYIAGPISKGDLQANVDQGRAAFLTLLRAGFAPLCPQLTCYMGGNSPEAMPCGTVHEDWMGVDLPWVAVSDAVLRLPGESVGADLETGLAGSLGIPVYDCIDKLIASPPVRGDERFHQLLREMGNLHARKQRDYGTCDDAFANIRASEAIGIPAWKGGWLRARDKVKRVDAFCLNGSLANEGLRTPGSTSRPTR